MAKTPISLLQELLIKEGQFPQYDDVGIRSDGVCCYFVCRVGYKNLSAEGMGTTKKEAKHQAAKNMLSLLCSNTKQLNIPTSSVPSSIPITTNHNNNILCYTPTKIGETAKERDKGTIVTQSDPTFINYVGMLQEFCVQRGLKISYDVVEQFGPPHKKTFTIEARVNAERKRGTAQCKKLAKQEAAKLMVQHLKDSGIFIETNGSVQQDKSNKSNKTNNSNKNFQEIYENGIQKLGVEIETSKPTLPIAELSKQAKSLFITYSKTNKKTTQDYLIKDSHSLFKRTYSGMITDNMKERMNVIREKHAADQMSVEKMICEIVSVLGVKIQQVNISSFKNNHVICLRLMSRPNITEFGCGESNDKAKTQAMYNIILDILTFLD